MIRRLLPLLLVIAVIDVSAGHFKRSGERKRRGDQEYTCPELAISAVCKGYKTNGFTYSDGCNEITCHIDGTGMSTLKFCPEPEDDAGKAYCRKAEEEMQDKKGQSSLRNRCLEASDVCRGPPVAYNDGCNQCRCNGQGTSGCTRAACPKVLMTESEFKEYCKDHGAGVAD